LRSVQNPDLKFIQQIHFKCITNQVCKNIKFTHNQSECGPISIVEMLHMTNLVLLVGLADFGDFSPRKVTIWSTNKNTVLCTSWSFNSPIKIAKINKKHMALVEGDKLHIYIIEKMERYHTFEVGAVTLGRLALSSNPEKNNFICCSSNSDEGMVRVFDIATRSTRTSIKAHKSPILKITLNYKGNMLATCSCKGTIIRIFSIPKGEKIITYKRGFYSAYIFSLNFSFDDEKIMSTSDTGTMHVFDLKSDLEGEE
jgi:autophagy-related protein 18